MKDHEHCLEAGRCWMTETQVAREGPCLALGTGTTLEDAMRAGLQAQSALLAVAEILNEFADLDYRKQRAVSSLELANSITAAVERKILGETKTP